MYLFLIFLFDRWPRQIVSSIGLCRYGGRIDCCWGWARRSWGQCQREYHPPGTSASSEVGLSMVIHGFTLHTSGLIPEQGLVVWFWHGNFLFLTPYSAPFLTEPLGVRYQFCYAQRATQDAHFSISPQYLHLLSAHPAYSFPCSRLWNGGKIMSLDYIYTKQTELHSTYKSLP